MVNMLIASLDYQIGLYNQYFLHHALRQKALINHVIDISSASILSTVKYSIYAKVYYSTVF
ncbi:MAG: hypothetical protein QXR17_07245 [Candidatus Bathyarchaeia archaeon]